MRSNSKYFANIAVTDNKPPDLFSMASQDQLLKQLCNRVMEKLQALQNNLKCFFFILIATVLGNDLLDAETYTTRILSGVRM